MVETEVDHGDYGQGAAYRRYQIQGENIAQEAVEQRRKCHTAGGSGGDKAQDGASVFFRQRQHHTGTEYGIADAV